VSDVLGAALRSLRIGGSTVLHEDYAPPWALRIPTSTDLAALLGQGDHRQAVAFHLVRKGGFTLRTSDGTSHRVRTGELAIVFGGASHTMSDGKVTHAVPLADALAAKQRTRGRARRPDATWLVCGVFVVQDAGLHPLFRALPDVLVAQAHPAHEGTGEPRSMLSNPIVELLVRELDRKDPGSTYAVSRLVELLCLEALRVHASSQTALPPGFLRGLSDEAAARAMRVIVERPEVHLSVAVLARAAGLSPSRFAARFREAVGESPLEFATRWRVDVAGRMLARSDASVAEIAERVGYQSPAAFSRAFSRVAGTSPRAFRDARRDASA
jgi:AraC-like DNA-binding protein